MPTIARIGPYRFFFYSEDEHEPEHVHVERDDGVAKFWLNPVRCACHDGFTERELRRVNWLVIRQRPDFMEAWHGYFDKKVR